MKHAPSTFSLCHPRHKTPAYHRTMSSKQRKKASLAALKSARSGRRSSSALDDVGLLEDDAANADVYEVMDEAEYRDYVQRKREREDFVVDDGEKSVVAAVVVVVAIDRRSEAACESTDKYDFTLLSRLST